jgi:hypothetical protein
MAEALSEVARALHWLGTADAATPMGAIEAHAAMVREAANIIADGIRDGLETVAQAIREGKEAGNDQ